jgi:ubiquinone/menaquinone biosynthesis C-methylase UbiE
MVSTSDRPRTPKSHRGLVASLDHARRYPDRAMRYGRRLRRDVALRLRYRDHISYYRAVVSDDLAHDQATAVGNSDRPAWRRFGRQQFRYLKRHGLQPDHRLLEIGCGNLRAGWLFIDYLDDCGYVGVDISPDVIMAAQDTVSRQGLADKLPYLTVVRDMRFAFLPESYFDYVHAHSVFSHCPLAVIEECFAHVGRIMKPDAVFDFTFYRTEGREFTRLREDFYYRTQTLAAAAQRHGLVAELMADWEGTHPQSKMRVRRA